MNLRTNLKVYNINEVESKETALNWIKNVYCKHFSTDFCYVSYLEANKEGDHSHSFKSIKDMERFILDNDKEPYNINIECKESNFAFLINVFDGLFYFVYGDEVNPKEIQQKLNHKEDNVNEQR